MTVPVNRVREAPGKAAETKVMMIISANRGRTRSSLPRPNIETAIMIIPR